jgi:trimeric autotransporter adhesin
MKKNLLIIVLLLAIQLAFGQLTGPKSIPGDYATIEAAIAALNTQGVGTGGVTFNVAAGHAETFTVPTAGLITAIGSSTDQIVFQKSGDGANPMITAATPGAGTMDYIICLSGSDYVTFDGINVQENAANTTSAMQMEWAYAVLKASETNGSQNNVIRNCSITLNPANTNSRAIYSNNHTTAATTQLVIADPAGTNSNNKFYGLDITNCYHGFYLYGRADATPFTYYDQNNEIGVDAPNVVTNLGVTGGTVASYGLYCYYQNNVKIANNTFSGMSDMASGSQYVMYLMTSTNANVDVYSNTVSMNYRGTGSFYGLYNSGMGSTGTSNTVNYYGNNIVNNTISSHTSGTVYFIYISTGGVTSNFYNNNVSNNAVGSANATSTGSIYYTYFTSSPSSTGTTNIYNNIVSNNIRTQSVPGSGTTYIFYNSGTSGGADGVTNVYNNTVNNITIASSGTTYGYYNLISSGVKNFYDNAVTNIYNSNGTTYGFYNSSGTLCNFYDNKVQNLNKNSATGTLYGFYIASGTNVYLYNNFISELYSPQSSVETGVQGVYFSGGTSHGMYNNSIYLDAASTDAAFGSCGIYTSTTPILELRNNIVVNVSTPGANGYTVAYRRSSTTIGTYGTASNNNDFYAGTPGPSNLIFYDATNADQTLADFQARVSPADASSISENPPFLNKTAQPYNLHMRTNVPTQLESGGAVVSAPVDITTDYDGDARYPNTGYPDNAGSPATAPDIGADEFGGLGTDLTPPNIAFTPLQNTSSTGARTLTTTITDASGVPTEGAGLPMLYWKINSGSYTPLTATWLGGDQYSFTFGAGVVLGDVVSYYLVAQDMATNVNVGAVPSGGASGFTTNPPACSTPPDPPLSYTILGSICGTFQVGTGQTYTTITEALADLVENEVVCPVVFELTDASYTSEAFPIMFVPVVGASDVNTITIRPAVGVTPTISGSSASSILKFEGGQYYIIDGSNVPGGNTRSLTIENTATSTSNAVVWFSSLGSDQGSPNNTLMNCNVMGGSNTVTSILGIYLGGATISTSGTGADNDGITIKNNRVSRTYYGIFAQGVPTIGELDDLVVADNTVGGDVSTDYVTGYGMRFQSINGAQITGNEIYNMIYDGSKYAMYMGTTIKNSIFSRNNIHAMGQTNTTATYYCTAMYFASTTNTINNQVSNNIIYDLYNYGSTSNFYGPIGIRIIGGDNYKIWFNSINLTGAFGSSTAGVYSHCLFISSATDNMDLRNNIFSNTLTGNEPRAYTVYTPSTSTFSPINFNDYYSTGSAIGYYGAEVADFAAWQVATGQDGASKNINPLFVSSTDLHPTNAALNNFGMYIFSVPEDYAGVNRTNPPDIGAYEFIANPEVLTLPATGVSATTATLNGSVNAISQVVNTYFDYGLTTDYGNTVAGVPAVISGNSVTTYSASLTNLTTSVVYHFRARGITGTGVVIYGDDMIFETVPPPTVTTTAATGLAQDGAVLNGIVNANVSTTAVSFEYGLTDSYGSMVSATPGIVTGNTDTPVSAAISGLTVNTTYHYRVVGTNSAGSAYGEDLTFTTLSAPPVVVTLPATNVLISTAQLNGTVTANNQTTTVSFEWGETIAYGNVVNAIPLSVEGLTPTSVMAEISGLLDNTVYHFRCIGVNATGTTYGEDQSFNTYCPPPGPAGPITGPASVCKPSAGQTYSVAPIVDATDYNWTVPEGATITSGANTPSITVDYDITAVSGNVTVYGSSNCGIGASSTLAVSVNPLPVPVITGPATGCITNTYSYSTESGMNNYSWTVSPGGQIMSGAGTHTITVKWNSAGSQYVNVTYTSASGCPAAAPTSLDVAVGTLTSPTIAGSDLMCVNSGLHVYTTQQGYSNYVWTVTSGGTIVSGQGTYQVEVNWTGAGAQSVSVNYANAFGCSASTPTSFGVTVMGLPGNAGAITGTGELCAGTMGVTYSVAAIPNTVDYVWTLPAGASIIDGANTNSITVDFALDAVSGDIMVQGENLCGLGVMSPPYAVTVNPIPATPVATVDEFFMLHSSAPEGNQWYFNGTMIEGATGQDYQAEEEGSYWTVVTLEGCVSDESNQVEVIFVGINDPDGKGFSIYPVPNDGNFVATMVAQGEETFSIMVYNDLGIKMYEQRDIRVKGKVQHAINLDNPATGIYTVIFVGKNQTVIRKILVTR